MTLPCFFREERFYDKILKRKRERKADGVYCFTTGNRWVKYADGVAAAIGKRVHEMPAGSDGSYTLSSLVYS